MASIGTRLYRGELGYDFIGRRRRWYIASSVIMTICLLSMIFRGFNFGIEFEGGNSFQFSGTEQQLEQAEAAAQTAGVEVASAQVVGGDAILLRTAELDNSSAAEVSSAIADALGIETSSISNSAVSAAWGGDITNKALQALAVFLIAVVIFIAIRFQPKMAVAALAALVNDVIVAAGVYSLIGFEVTPSTVIGLLTILGFSLYDTVVVFDKVDENTRGILGGSRSTYSEAANLAVNQTLMRSINTSLIALLPVAGLLFVGAGLLGAGTLKDLALVLFVGLATGAYSSIFLATPILCDLKEREPAYAALAKRVEARKASGRGVDSEPVVRLSKPARRTGKAPSRPAARTPGGRPAAKKTPAGASASKPTVGTSKARPSAVEKPPVAKPTGSKRAAAGTTAAGSTRTGSPTSGSTRSEIRAAASTAASNSNASSAGADAAEEAVDTAPAASVGDDSASSAPLRPSARRTRPAMSNGDASTGGAAGDGDHLEDERPDEAAPDSAEREPAADETPEPVGAASPTRPAGGQAAQRSRGGRPAGKSTTRRGGRPSGKRKR